MTQSEQFEMVIIGGGISGLSLAHYLSKAGRKVLVLEGDEKIGGCVNTTRFEDQEYWMEMGAHTCYNSYSQLIDIALDNNLGDKLVAREKLSLKLFNGELKGIFSRLNLFQLMGSLPRMFFLKKEGQSVESFYSRVLGKKNYARLFSRLFSAVIVQPADEYAADLFLKRRDTRRKEFPKSFTFTKGMQELLDTIAANDKVEVRTQAKVEKLNREENGYRIETHSGESILAKHVALAVEPNAAAKLLKEIQPELAGVLEEIPVQRVHSRGVKLEKKDLDLERLAFVIPVEGPCYSIVTRDVVDDPDSRAFAFHFEEGALDEEKQLKEMEKLLGPGRFTLDQTVEARHRLPLLKAGHPQKVEQMDRLLEEENLYLTGNFFDGLSLEDCVARSHKEFSRYMKK